MKAKRHLRKLTLPKSHGKNTALKTWMSLHRVTQEELSRAIGVTRQSIDAWANGRRPNFRHATLVSRATGIPVAALMGLE